MPGSKDFSAEYYAKQYKPSPFHARGDNPFVHSFWVKQILKLNSGGRFLEVGCGEGYFLKRMAHFFSAWGMDISSDGIARAQQVATKAQFRVGDAASLPFEGDFFDVVAAFDLVEHLSKPEVFLGEAFRVLKKEGLLVLRTPNPLSFGAQVKGDAWFGRQDETHISIRQPWEWCKIITASKFSIIAKGTDTLWDAPYFGYVPKTLQRIFFIGIHQILHFLGFGFFPWRHGENWICIARKVSS